MRTSPQIDELVIIPLGHSPRARRFLAGHKGSDWRYDAFDRRHRRVSHLSYRIESASEKIGRYKEINTKATKIPMKIMITRFDQAECRRGPGGNVFFVKLRHAAEHRGSAPVDSPTSIISIERPGKS